MRNSTAGNRGQFEVVIPPHDLVIVRRGLEYGRHSFDWWNMVWEIMKAVPAS